MVNQLLEFIEKIKIKAEQFKKYDEIHTKQSMILPILKYLDWDVWDPEEVKPEHPVEGWKAAEGGKSDFCLKINEKSRIFLEVKNPSEDLEKHQRQLLEYSFSGGVDIAILSNGITWWFYLPMEKGDWKERKFYEIDIAQQGHDEIADKFMQLLLKQNVQSGESLKNAEFIFKELNRKKNIQETLPKAWNEVVLSYHTTLLNLLAETTETMCGIKPEAEDIKNMLIKYEEKLLLTIEKTEKPPISKSATQTTKSPYGHRINSKAGQIDMLWHQLKEKMGRSPTVEEVSEASNKTLTVSRVTAHLKYWQKHGRYATEEPKVAIWDHKEKMKILGDFIAENCLVIPEAFATAKELYQAYIDWAVKAGKKMHLSKRAFGICLGERGFQKGKGTTGMRIWRGISLAN